MPIDVSTLMKQVERIKVITNRLVEDKISGEYHSVFKGQGIEFDEVREYVAGDDVRSIDWNVTARMGHPYVKRFCEERELTILFVIDVSGSMGFGSVNKTKIEAAAELTALMALSAIKNQDKVGLIIFSDRIEKFIPARKGRNAVMRIVRELLAIEPTQRKTNIVAALDFLDKVQKRKAVVFLVSDFVAEDYEDELRVLAKHHDIIACTITDRREKELKNVGLIDLLDAETGDMITIDTSSTALRQKFSENYNTHKKQLILTLNKLKIDSIEIETDKPFINAIHRLFTIRKMRKSR